VDKLTN